ncbi:cytidyltransferase-like domain-containing protein [Nitrosomonas sp. Nm51]|uniref:adenylyltransferase/cytidyltransferase family protein n=1 Tax=Nitrosomonas sp. Nm51 TaxID=133720 RepID=UPI0008CAC929|nr:adenylyltransferase/cytidyltransferase family protein [Nitrosomonas sp. Nm51]SER56291.1 cytidyltransferase-like domain-containing protein [Nitrosomonas sp. Nm51]
MKKIAINKKDQADLLRAKQSIEAGHLGEAGDLLNMLKKKLPTHPDVARLWCSWALRTDRAPEVPAYAKQLFLQADNDIQKAHWAHLLGTTYFYTLDLPRSLEYFGQALAYLSELARSGKAPAPRKKSAAPPSAENVFVSGYAERLLWSTCAMLARQDIPAFPFAGTLLGLEREGKLLDFDKDIDIAVWMSSFDACCATLEAHGWSVVPMHIEYRNYRDFIHNESGITLDVCGLEQRNRHQIIGGFALSGRSDDYQRVTVFPHLELKQRSTQHGNSWYPAHPEKILTAFYGDWRTPNPFWDTVVSALNLEKFTLLVRCYAYHRLVKRWLSGDLIKAWSYACQIALKDPDDVRVLRAGQWLERILMRTGQVIPHWPQNRPQRRVYTRMVADLFHTGHINFLHAAKSLGTHLTVCVVSDQRVLENKGKLPVMNQAERAAAVAACRYVDAVITESPVNATPEFMQQHGFDIYTFACADERERTDKYRQCALLPSAMIRELDYTQGISSTEIVNRILRNAGYDR